MTNLIKLGQKIIDETYPDLNESLFDSTPAKWGKLIMARRLQQGFTQAKLAEIAEMEPKTISRVEGGNSDVKMSTYLKLFKVLGVSQDETGEAIIKKAKRGNKPLVGSH